MTLTAETGRYAFAVLEAKSGESTSRALTVIDGGGDGRIVAASAPVLVGMSRAEAEAFMAATPKEKQEAVAAAADSVVLHHQTHRHRHDTVCVVALG